jgi:hypothetical protein
LRTGATFRLKPEATQAVIAIVAQQDSLVFLGYRDVVV